MAASEFSSILTDVLAHTSDDIPRLVKAIESLIHKLKQPSNLKDFCQDGQTNSELVKMAVQAYCHSLTSAKLARTLDKAFKCLPQSFTSCVNQEIEVVLQELLGRNTFKDFRTLSALLDQNAVAKKALKNCLPSLTQLLKNAADALKAEDVVKLPKEREEHIHYFIKLSVQVLQHFTQEIKTLFACHQAEEVSALKDKFPTLMKDWESIIAALLILLIQSSNKDIVLLTGTAVAMLFNSAPDHESIQNSYMDVISVLSHDKKNITFSGLQFDVGAAVSKTAVDTSVALMAIIKGLLVSCDKETLSNGHNPLMMQVFPYILSMCRGPTVHHYLAFQLLALWYQKLQHVGDLHISAFNVGLLLNQLNLTEKAVVSFMPDTSENASSPDVAKEADAGHTSKSELITLNSFAKDSCERDSLNARALGALSCDSGLSAQSLRNFVMHDTSCGHVGKEPADLQSTIPIMSQSCPVLESTLTCIWLNWDSPVDGVSESVAAIFSHLLIVWHQRLKSGMSDNHSLGQHLMRKVLSMAWHTRTRYRPMSLLLPYLDCSKLLQENPQLKADLMRCMKTNHMAAIASDVYKAFLQQIICCDETRALQEWTETWLPTLLSGLISSDSLQRLKTCTYWLPPTLKQIPGSEAVLLNTLEMYLNSADVQQRELWLYAWVTVSRTVRDLLHAFAQLQVTDLLKEALYCDEEGVRSEALMYVCSTVKRAEPMSEDEADLLKTFLPTNLKTDSAPFRQNLTSALKKMLVRVRDSCLSAVRNNRTEETFLEQSLHFVDWLHSLLMLSLAPGGSYQRRQTTFDILVAMLETLVYQDQDLSKKGKAQESASILIEFAQAQGMWNFFGDENFITVLACLEDGAEEIQTQSYNLLLKYFKWPKAVSCESTSQSEQSRVRKNTTSLEAHRLASKTESSSLLCRQATVLHLINRAFVLTSSPRAHENHSGLLMMSLVLNRYVIDLGLTVSAPPSTCSSNEISEPMVSLNSTNHDEGKVAGQQSAYKFLDLLVDKVKTSMGSVQQDLATGFKTHPIHGLTQCVIRCTLDITKNKKRYVSPPEEDWSKRLEDIITLNQAIITLVLEVLAGGRALENCPSFADMGIALDYLISAPDQEQEEEMMSLSPEFQLLLSWCWLNLRESCTCLGSVTSIAVPATGNSYLTAKTLSSIGQTFVKVLTTCRHRGAIEGCRGGLSLFCTTLMSSSAAEINAIPETILRLILDSISENSLTASVTRRSAGLPIIVQTVIQAARKCGNTDLLLSTVEHLYNVACQPLPVDHNQHQDLSQSHALNILKVIFCDASLAPLLMPLLSKMTILVVEGFDSPSWAIRNAATQLISTLVTRIFGQKNKVDNSSNMTLEEFSVLYPELLQFVCDKLKTCMASKTMVRPSLYIILTLLSSLGMSPSHQHSSSCRDFLQDAVLFFLSNPVYSLRKLSAEAYVALSALDAADITMKALLQRIRQRERTMNEFHGWLLAAHCLISSGAVSNTMCKEVVLFIVENEWLLQISSWCLLPVSTLMQMIQLALFQVELDVPILERLWNLVDSFISSMCTSRLLFQVDRDHCIQQCVKTLASIQKADASTDNALRPRFIHFLHGGLSSSLIELHQAVLNCLQDNDADFIKDPDIQKDLLANMIKDTNIPSFIQSVDILVTLNLRGDLHLQVSDLQSLDFTSVKSRWGQVHNVEVAIFSLEGLIIGLSTPEKNELRGSSLLGWCKQLLNFTDPCANENLRLNAAQCLCMAGGNILKFCDTKRDLAVDDILSSILKACLRLLEDTEMEVRHSVATFISKLQERATLHYNLCYAVLSEIFCEQVSWSTGVISTLLDILHSPDQLTSAITSALNTGPQPLFEPETSSAMSEMFMTQIWAYNTLRVIMTGSNKDILQPQLKVVATSCLRELSKSMSLIRDNLSAEPIFNLSCNENVMTTLLGAVLLSDLYTKCREDSISTTVKEETEKSDVRQLHELVMNLQQIPSLHPFLQWNKAVTDQFLLCNLLERSSPRT